MKKNFFLRFGSIAAGAILLLSLTMAVRAQSTYPLNAYASESWDIIRDSNNRLYAIWFNEGTIYYGEIVDNKLKGSQIIATHACILKYGRPQLSVKPDGSAMCVIYIDSFQKSVKNVWRTTGAWHTETIFTSESKFKVYFQVGGVDGSGTMHAVWTHEQGTFYSYKRLGQAWSQAIEIIHVTSEGSRFVVDLQGNSHCTIMPYMTNLYYWYIPSGSTLNQGDIESIDTNCPPLNHSGIGDIFVTRDGTVHQSFFYNRMIYHTSKPAGGHWPVKQETWVGNSTDTGLEIRPSVGADAVGNVFVSWGDANKGVVMLSTFKDGKWSKQAVGTNTDIGDFSEPAITVTDDNCYVMWNQNPDDQLILYSFPVFHVMSAIIVGVQHVLEKSFLKSHYINRVTWEDAPINIQKQLDIDHYNVYRKAKSEPTYDMAHPLAANILAGTYGYDDLSSEANTGSLNFDYAVTTVALIDGKLVESEIIYAPITIAKINDKPAGQERNR